MSIVTALSPTERKEAEYIESLKQRLCTWRLREGKSYFSMPTPLWDEAIAVAHKKGLGFASRALGLSRDELKRRVALKSPAAIETGSPDTSESAEAIEFIELPGAAAALLAPPPAAAAPLSVATTNADRTGDAIVEVFAVDGAKLTVRVPASALNIVTLVHEFRGRA